MRPERATGTGSAARRRRVPHSLELLPHPLAMRPGPVDPQAVRTVGEALLSGEHVRGNPGFDRRLEHGDHRCVTRYAAGEERGARIERTRMDDLMQLFTEVVAGDEDDGEPGGGARHAVVSGQYRPAFGPGLSYQAAPGQVRTIGGVLPDQPQPGGEPTEHRVYREAGGTHHVPTDKIRGT
jgi:hypothetical protein